MKAYLVRVEKNLYPFGRPASQMRFKMGTLRERLLKQLEVAGLKVVEVLQSDETKIEGNSIVIHDDVLLSDSLLKTFLKAVAGSKNNLQLEMDVSRFPFLTQKDCESEFKRIPLFYFRQEAAVGDVPNAKVTLNKDAPYVATEGLPEKMNKLENLQLHFLDLFAVHIQHWFDFQVATSCYCGEFVAKAAVPLSILPTKISGRVFRWSWLMEKVNQIGKNTRIHPTAVIEGCVIGDNVEIGPYAYLRSSVIGDNVVIRERTTSALSYIGEGAFIASSTVLNSYVGKKSSVVTPMLYNSVFGEGSFISGGSGFADFNAGSNPISAQIENNEERQTSLVYLGCGVGDECFIGANMIFAPGRVIASGSNLLDNGLLKNLPQEGDNTYVLSGNNFVQIPKSFFAGVNK